MIGIYKFTNRINGKVYIGQSKNISERHKAHINSIYKEDTSYFHKALKKYGVDVFDFEVIKECPESELNYWEIYYIKQYSANNKEYGYNMTSGGDGVKDLPQEVLDILSIKGKKLFEDEDFRDKHSKATREGMKHVPRELLQTQLNKPRTTEEKTKIGDKLRGKPKPPGFGEASSKRQKGKKLTDEHINNLKKAKENVCWITNGCEEHLIHNEELDIYINKGFYKGRLTKKQRSKHIG